MCVALSKPRALASTTFLRTSAPNVPPSTSLYTESPVVNDA